MHMDCVLKKEYEIKYYEQNVLGNLKESALLNFLQDIATISAEQLGFGATYTFARNYAWVVLKYHIELYKELNNLPKIIIKTESIYNIAGFRLENEIEHFDFFYEVIPQKTIQQVFYHRAYQLVCIFAVVIQHGILQVRKAFFLRE